MILTWYDKLQAFLDNWKDKETGQTRVAPYFLSYLGKGKYKKERIASARIVPKDVSLPQHTLNMIAEINAAKIVEVASTLGPWWDDFKEDLFVDLKGISFMVRELNAPDRLVLGEPRALTEGDWMQRFEWLEIVKIRTYKYRISNIYRNALELRCIGKL